MYGIISDCLNREDRPVGNVSRWLVVSQQLIEGYARSLSLAFATVSALTLPLEDH
jgi:hypothetical protein